MSNLDKKPFDNRTINAPCHGKPHIIVVDGYWRVSKYRKRDGFPVRLWHQAHDYVSKANVERKGHDCNQ